MPSSTTFAASSFTPSGTFGFKVDSRYSDDALNPPAVQGLGRLVAEVGVAPAAPLEYLLLRLTQDADGGVKVVTEP